MADGKQAGSGAAPGRQKPEAPKNFSQARTPTVVVRADKALAMGRNIRRLEKKLGATHVFEPDSPEPPPGVAMPLAPAAESEDTRPALPPPPSLPPPPAQPSSPKWPIVLGALMVFLALGVVLFATFGRSRSNEKIRIVALPNSPSKTTAAAKAPAPAAEKPAAATSESAVDVATEVASAPEAPSQKGVSVVDDGDHTEDEKFTEAELEADELELDDVGIPDLVAPKPKKPEAAAAVADKKKATKVKWVKLIFDIEPADAAIVFNGRKVKKVVLTRRTRRRRTLVVTAPGYQTYRTVLAPNRSRKVQISLEEEAAPEPTGATEVASAGDDSKDEEVLEVPPAPAEKPKTNIDPDEPQDPPSIQRDVEEDKPPPAEKPETGIIRFVGAPAGTQIELTATGFAKEGKMPFGPLELKPGIYSIWGSLKQHEQYFSDVQVRAGKTITVKVTMKPIKQLSLDDEPQ